MNFYSIDGFILIFIGLFVLVPLNFPNDVNLNKYYFHCMPVLTYNQALLY